MDAVQSGEEARVQAPWREPVIRQFTIHCERSAIVFDERRAGKHATVPESPYVGTVGLWAGERAPNPLEMQVLHGAESLEAVGTDAAVDAAQGFLEIVHRQPRWDLFLSSFRMHRRAFP
jgi:hypothetical protein